MKRKTSGLLAALLSASLLLTACTSTGEQTGQETPAPTPSESQAAQTEQTGMTPGTYVGIGEGRNGAIVVEVTVGESSIDSIEVVSHKETYHVGEVPLLEYPEQIVANQSLAVDNVSGATISSMAFLSAVKDCITQAGGDPADFDGEIPSTAVAEDCTADVVVVGAGGAGMTAAIHAAQAGKQVILLEKLGFVGGTSCFSIESMGASESNVHKALGTPVTMDQMYENYVNANPNGIPEAFDILAHNNGAAVDWLKSIGAMLTVTSSGSSVASSREAGKLGLVIVSALEAECEKAGVDIRLNSAATELVMEDGAVTGVKVENDAGTYTISAKSVVLATGGFGANSEMVTEQVPELEGYLSSCSVGATGDGHNMAAAVGAQLRDMDYFRVNFTYHTQPNGYYYYMGSLFNTGAIFVNDAGQRFVNDQGGYGVGMQVVEQGGSGWAIFDNSIVSSMQDVREYMELGLFEQADTIEELAEKIGVDPAALQETITTYQGYVANGVDEEFGRAMLNMTFDEAPYYACRMTCRVQGTFGGIATDTDTRVLTEDGQAIPGLYAAGECASVGTWGANPVAVNLVFGKIAGENAAAWAE